jgi:hypothetical protein
MTAPAPLTVRSGDVLGTQLSPSDVRGVFDDDGFEFDCDDFH